MEEDTASAVEPVLDREEGWEEDREKVWGEADAEEDRERAWEDREEDSQTISLGM